MPLSSHRFVLDENGRPTMFGLSFDETSELKSLDALPDWQSKGEAFTRYFELYQKHEQAWHYRFG